MISAKNEFEFKKWFEKNFEELGYSKIIKIDNGKFSDFIMLKNKRKIGVELETLYSNFILHNHDQSKVDEVVCIKKDVDPGIPIIEVEKLKHTGGKKRISFTVDEGTANILKLFIKDGVFRNKSHVIEEAIKSFKKEKDDKK